MSVLVAAASRHGATAEIADRIAADLAPREGDWRDWAQVDAWATSIAAQLERGVGS